MGLFNFNSFTSGSLLSVISIKNIVLLRKDKRQSVSHIVICDDELKINVTKNLLKCLCSQ